MRRLAAVAASLLALGLGACGSGDESATGGEAAQEQAQQRSEAEAEQRNAEVRREHEERKAAEAPSEEEEQAQGSATRVYRGLGDVVGARFVRPDVNVRAGLEAAEGNEALEGVCELMSSAAQEETIAYARASSGLGDVEWSCEKAMALLIRRAHVNKAAGRIRNAEVIAVNAEGDRATATVRFGKRQPLSTIPLVREDGEWKLGSSPAGGGGS